MNRLILCLIEKADTNEDNESDEKEKQRNEDFENHGQSINGEFNQDYRFAQLIKLQSSLCSNQDVVYFNIAGFALAEMSDASIFPLLESSLRSHLQQPCDFYFTSFVLDLKRVFRFLNLFLRFCTPSRDLEQPQRNLTLVEDLIFVPRVYIYSNSEKNFFRNSLNLAERYPRSVKSISLQSSNEILNWWGEEDTYLVSLSEVQESPQMIWSRVLEEIQFQEMFMQGNAVPRLICIQSIQDPVKGFPIYRHPNDQEPENQEMSSITHYLRAIIEREIGLVGLNHVLIQWYRDGRDNIASHSDKTLDIDLSTPIVNLSIGSTREMYLQKKTHKSHVQKIPLRHGDCVVFGLKTNQFWWHEVPKNVLLPAHPIYGTGRVSFTFRKINTFFHPSLRILIGQGSPYKTIEQAQSLLALEPSIQPPEDEEKEKEKKAQRSELIMAFSKENRLSAEFSWREVYGKGFLCTS